MCAFSSWFLPRSGGTEAGSQKLSYFLVVLPSQSLTRDCVRVYHSSTASVSLRQPTNQNQYGLIYSSRILTMNQIWGAKLGLDPWDCESWTWPWRALTNLTRMHNAIRAQLRDTNSLFVCQERFALRHVQGTYPFEQYTCSSGKRLLSDHHLPKWFWWYAAPNKKLCDTMHRIDLSLSPPQSTELVAGGVVGAVRLCSVSRAVAFELCQKYFPQIFIDPSATQYFVVLQRVAFRRTVPVKWKQGAIRLMTLLPECKHKCLQMLLSEGTCMHTHTEHTHIYTHTIAYTHCHTHSHTVFVCVFVCARTFVRVWVCVCVCVCLTLYVYVCLCVCLCHTVIVYDIVCVCSHTLVHK